MSQLPIPSASVEAYLETSKGRCGLTYEPLNTEEIIKYVGDERAGATAVFIGTTRNSFRGKAVTRLEYQAYSKLAIRTIANTFESTEAIISKSRDSDDQNFIRCAVYHRLGTVSVGDPSIVIAVSAPHRKEAFLVCEQILEDVKRKAQIWKREYYEGEEEEDAQWKENY